MVPTWSHAMAQPLLLRSGAGSYPDAEVCNKGCVRRVSLTSSIKPSGARASSCQGDCDQSVAKSGATDAASNKRCVPGELLPPSVLIILNSIISLKKGNGVPCPPAYRVASSGPTPRCKSLADIPQHLLQELHLLNRCI